MTAYPRLRPLRGGIRSPAGRSTILAPMLTGAELRERRERLGLSGAQMADMMGVRAESYRRWEKNEREIRCSGAVALALEHLEHLAAEGKL